MGRPAASCGDQYCFVGLESYTKLVLAWHMGDRVHDSGWAFCRKLAHACHKHPYQVASDAWSPYKRLIPNMLGRVDYGQIIKIFATSKDEPSVRYSPGQIIEVKRKAIAGNPDLDRLNTSYVERHNLSMRMKIRRLTRLTNCFSRKMANHRAALGLYFAHYNFCQRHGTIKTTPAVAAGLTQERWTTEELIERTASYVPPKPEWQSYLDSLPSTDKRP
jgi:IS1 family transposase